MTYDIDTLIQIYYDHCKSGPAYMQSPNFASEEGLYTYCVMYDESITLGESPVVGVDSQTGLTHDQLMFILTYDGE